MILPSEKWMDLRRYRPLHAAGATYKEIAAEVGCDWRTVRKYLTVDAPVAPPTAPLRVGTQPRKIERFTHLIDAWLAEDDRLRASVIHERLVAEYGFDGHYQRVKTYVRDARDRLALERAGERPSSGLHRRFEVVPGGQAQVDWGHEDSSIAKALGVRAVYSFHMTLSFSRDPFSCFTISQDLATFWACHTRAFQHFGGVPGSIVYDRTKTVVRTHVAPGKAVPLHPEAVAFAGHYGFTIDVAAAYRPTAKGRVERQVLIVRDHVLAGRRFASLTELDGAFERWLPIRRRQTHRTHGEVIAARAARDRAALLPLPATDYVVADRHLRRVGKDCLVSFGASLYSVPATLVTPGMTVEVRATGDTVTLRALGPEQLVLAQHRRARHRRDDQINPAHWHGLPDGSSRTTTTGAAAADRHSGDQGPEDCEKLAVVLAHRTKLTTPVATRDMAVYDAAAGLTPAAGGGR